MLTWKIKDYVKYSDRVDVQWEASVTVDSNTATNFGQTGIPVENETITEQFLIDSVKASLGVEEIALFETVLTAQAQGDNP